MPRQVTRPASGLSRLQRPYRTDLEPGLGAADPQLATMGLRHQSAQRQTETDAPGAARACTVGAVEGLAELLQPVGRHAGAVIAHAQRQPAIGLGAQEQRRRCRCAGAVAQRVVDQVAQQQPHPCRVGGDGGHGVVQPERDAAAPAASPALPALALLFNAGVWGLSWIAF